MMSGKSLALLRHALVSWRSSSHVTQLLSVSPGITTYKVPLSVTTYISRRLVSSHLHNLLDRKAYDERYYQHVQDADIKKMDVVSEGKHVEITWQNGDISRFHSLWLRYSCFCSKCRTDNRGQTIMPFHLIPDDQKLLSATDDGAGCLVVRWQNDEADHTGLLPLRFLKYNCYSPQSLATKRQQRRVKFSEDVDDALRLCVIPRTTFEQTMNDQAGVYRLVKYLNEEGVILVSNVPCEDGMSKQLCQRISPFIRHTIYGETFDVKMQHNPVDASYTGAELRLHMDQVQYESPPGLQALHCLQFDETISGGESQFVDMFHVAESYRILYPEDFHLLCRLPSTYETVYYSRDWPVHMRYKRPMFTCNNYNDIVGVIWHPHMLGPLEIEEENLDDFFRAFKNLACLVNDFPHVYRHRLKPGEMVVFNNRRMVHGRGAFDSQRGGRHLQGCYVEVSEFKSLVHVLSNLVGQGDPVKRVGDNDWQ